MNPMTPLSQFRASSFAGVIMLLSSGWSLAAEPPNVPPCGPAPCAAAVEASVTAATAGKDPATIRVAWDRVGSTA